MGWYPGLEQRYRQAIPNATVPNTTCHLPRPDAFHMFRDAVSGDIPWPGLVFGLTVLATWCWCTDQVMVPSPGLALPTTNWGGSLRETGCLDAQRVGAHSGTSIGAEAVTVSGPSPSGLPPPLPLQVIVQRSLSAKSLSHAKGGSVLGGYLKILPMFFIVMPGMISRALYPGESAPLPRPQATPVVFIKSTEYVRLCGPNIQ